MLWYQPDEPSRVAQRLNSLQRGNQDRPVWLSTGAEITAEYGNSSHFE